MTVNRYSQYGEVPNYGGGPVGTSFGTLLPPGAKVAGYVHSSGRAFVDDATIDKAGLYRTVNAALARCRAGYGDTVVVLPGHTETISGANGWSNMVAGCNIIGHGRGSLRPTISFSATASQLAVAVANVLISGMQFNVDGANGVVNAIDVNGADFTLQNCVVRLASGAALKATIGMSLSAARARVVGCKFFGTATHNVTDGILIDTAVDGIEITDTVMMASATAANGLIRVTAAATNLLFRDLVLYNTHTSSTATIALGDVACDGLALRVNSGTKNNGGAKTSQGITWGTAALVQAHECYCSDVRVDSGVLSPAAAAA